METQTLPLSLPDGRLKMVQKDLSLLLNTTLGDGSDFRPLVYLFYENCKGHRLFLTPPIPYSDYLKNDNCVRVIADYIRAINNNPDSVRIDSYCYVENIEIKDGDKKINALMIHWVRCNSAGDYDQRSCMVRYSFVGSAAFLEAPVDCFFYPDLDSGEHIGFHNFFLPIDPQVRIYPNLARKPLGYVVNDQPN